MIFTIVLLLLCVFLFILGFTPFAKKPSDRKLALISSIFMSLFVLTIPLVNYLDIGETNNKREWLILELELDEEIDLDLIERCINFNKSLESKKKTSESIVFGFSKFGMDYDSIDVIDLNNYIEIVTKDKNKDD